MADQLDLLTPDEARAAVKFKSGSESTQDDKLAAYVTAVSGRLDDLCGPIVERFVEAEEHDGGDVDVLLELWPVASIDSVSEWATGIQTILAAETNAASTVNDYRIDLKTGILRRRTGRTGTKFAAGVGNVVVAYTAGRFANTETVGAKFKTAAAQTLDHLWNASAGAWTKSAAYADQVPLPDSPVPGWMVPRAVLQLLGRELQGAKGMG